MTQLDTVESGFEQKKSVEVKDVGRIDTDRQIDRDRQTFVDPKLANSTVQ